MPISSFCPGPLRFVHNLERNKCLVLLARLSLPTCAPLALFQNGSNHLPHGMPTSLAIAELALYTMTFVRRMIPPSNSAHSQCYGSAECGIANAHKLLYTVVEERPDVQRVRVLTMFSLGGFLEPRRVAAGNFPLDAP